MIVKQKLILIRELILFIIMLCYSYSYAEAQNLEVGDMAPSINAFRWVKGVPITEFKKGEVYVVEFGATWCKPCAINIPKLTTLAEKYKGQVHIMSFFVMEYNDQPTELKNPKYVNGVERYAQRHGDKMRYGVAVDDPQRTMERTWLKAAGKNGIPYTFVIDKDGRIAWIGIEMETVDRVLSAVISDNYNIIEAKNIGKEVEAKKTPYDETQLLLINGNGGDEDDFLYRSLLTKYNDDIVTGHHLFVQSYRWAQGGSREAKFQGKIQEINASLSHLYYMAYADTVWNLPNSRNSNFYTSYGKYWFEPLLEVTDESPFKWSYESSKNKYNYSLKVPLEKATALFLQKVMRRDLKTYFGYEVNVETRMMPYWSLSALPEGQLKLRSKIQGKKYDEIEMDRNTGYSFSNGSIKGLIFVLWGYTFNQTGAPIIDETGIEGEIDLELKANLDNIEDVKKSLNRMGLKLEKSKREMKVVVIKDPNDDDVKVY